MLGVFPDVPFFIKAGDHKSLAITRYLAFSLFSYRDQLSELSSAS